MHTLTEPDLWRKLCAEALGTAFLLIGVVGSGIMADTLSNGSVALTLLANAIATGCILYVIITVLGPISGAHFNPAVTLAFYVRKEISRTVALGFALMQIVGAITGVCLTHLMFELPIFQLASTARTGVSQWVSEGVATFGLLFVIFGGLRSKPEAVPTLVALYITGAYWFTSSTSFANPAVTIARGLSDTFAGIAPAGLPAFIFVQLVTVVIAMPFLAKLFSK
ncbi:aquaporin [Nereida sp. NH-UV-3]|uniref:aquaporin n=1 Tax=Nereida TaxID=282198 RepID=UPI0036F2CDE9